MAKNPIFAVIGEQYDSIECNFYSTIAGTAYSAALVSAFTGQWYATGGAALIGGAAQLTAELAGCNAPAPPEDFYNPGYGGHCWKCNDVASKIRQYREDGSYLEYNITDCTAITQAYFFDRNGPSSTWSVFVLSTQGTISEWANYGRPTDTFGLVCDCAGEDAPLPPHSPGQPISAPYDVDDGVCQWTVQAEDSYVGDDGRFHVFYVIRAKEGQEETCGGPFSFWSTDGGPVFVPVDPDRPTPPSPNPPGPDTRDIERILEEIKNCACNEAPKLEGDYRTISFRSHETSPYGKSRLRKRFRYRSLSGNDLGAVVDHWKDFTWEGGPYRVRWVGESWRTPEVWAATEAEGQRVIQHAAREAGVYPLEDGRWSTRVSSSTRLGVRGSFAVDTTGGYYWITARDGSSERPLVAR